jgi:hypothetical protein
VKFFMQAVCEKLILGSILSREAFRNYDANLVNFSHPDLA